MTPIQLHFALMERLLAERPLERWQIWIELSKQNGLTVREVIRLISRAKKSGWITEHDGCLHLRQELSRTTFLVEAGK